MGFSCFFRQLVTGHHLLGTLWMISTNGAPSSGAPSAPVPKKVMFVGLAPGQLIIINLCLFFESP